MSLAEQLREALAARREAIDNGNPEAIERARAEHLRVVGEILVSERTSEEKPGRGRRER